MDLSGQTIMRWARARSGSPEHQLDLMRQTRRGQTLMFVTTLTVLVSAFLLMVAGEVVLGGALAIVWTLFAFGVSLYVTFRFP